MAIGDLVATMTVPGQSFVVYDLESNPGGYFTISGNLLIEAINTPPGVYPVTIKATGSGFSVVMPFSLTFAQNFSDPVPVIF